MQESSTSGEAFPLQQERKGHKSFKSQLFLNIRHGYLFAKTFFDFLNSLNITLFFLTEMKRMSVFKNYEAGEPTCRLYVKNISKQVEEKVRLYGASEVKS